MPTARPSAGTLLSSPVAAVRIRPWLKNEEVTRKKCQLVNVYFGRGNEAWRDTSVATTRTSITKSNSSSNSSSNKKQQGTAAINSNSKERQQQRWLWYCLCMYILSIYIYIYFMQLWEQTCTHAAQKKSKEIPEKLFPVPASNSAAAVQLRDKTSHDEVGLRELKHRQPPTTVVFVFLILSNFSPGIYQQVLGFDESLALQPFFGCFCCVMPGFRLWWVGVQHGPTKRVL